MCVNRQSNNLGALEKNLGFKLFYVGKIHQVPREKEKPTALFWFPPIPADPQSAGWAYLFKESFLVNEPQAVTAGRKHSLVLCRVFQLPMKRSSFPECRKTYTTKLCHKWCACYRISLYSTKHNLRPTYLVHPRKRKWDEESEGTR